MTIKETTVTRKNGETVTITLETLDGAYPFRIKTTYGGSMKKKTLASAEKEFASVVQHFSK